ncbi:MAG: hypothetical protein ASARMPREDX12_001929 [Alectoria sarmentosa]|nr:MAG: hypothetical protein ASARMPREDX12_001929 [Alectoria sarmentosa]
MNYLVPNTQTRLKIFFGSPIDSVVLQLVLESVRSFCTLIINQDGDSWLPSDLDPYSRNGPYGGNVQMRSVQDQHLTYKILRSTMQGLLNVLVIGGEDYDVEVEVFELDWSLVAIGHLMLSTYHGHAPLSQLLLSHGADPNRLNDRNQSPLAGAVFKNENEIVDILLRAGADVDLGRPSAWEAVELFKKTDEYGEKFSRQREMLKSEKGGGEEGKAEAKGGVGGTKGASQMI